MSINEINYTTKRLLNDYRSFLKNHDNFENINVVPLENDIYEWHGNISPKGGYYDGLIIHFIMKFPDDYPTNPPNISLENGILHSNIIPNFRGEKYFLCMDLINNFFWYNADGVDKSKPYSGWSSSYTIEIIINQLYSFLFDENIENYDGRIKNTFYELPPEMGGGHIDYDTIENKMNQFENESKNLECSCGHTYNTPYPKVKLSDGKNRNINYRKKIFINS